VSLNVPRWRVCKINEAQEEKGAACQPRTLAGLIRRLCNPIVCFLRGAFFYFAGRPKKVGHLALAIQVAFQELGVFPASNTAVPVEAKDAMPFSRVQAVETSQRVATMGRIVMPSTGSFSGTAENGDLTSLQRELQHALASEISRKEVALRTVPDGLVISLREIGFFESASADIKSSSQPAFSRIVSLLAERDYRIRIEGHTDRFPIHNSRFNSNWELSTARATRLVRLMMVKYGFARERLSAAGYAAYHPVASNDTAEGRAQNRRIDVVILGKFTSPG
jgi:chemotaxis protein MotB